MMKTRSQLTAIYLPTMVNCTKEGNYLPDCFVAAVRLLLEKIVAAGLLFEEIQEKGEDIGQQ